MADENAEGELEWIGRSSLLDEQTFFAMESLQATLQQLEAELRQQDISQDSSTEYCDNFCQALIHYAGSRNSLEHGLSLLEVYCLSINCFAAARPHLTGESPNVGLVLKRLALSCLELLLSVPQHEIPLEAWLQFHGSVQAAHESILQYGSTDLQALLNILGEGGAWNNPVLVSLLTDQQTEPGEVNSYLALEGEGFMEMRIKHLEKVGEDEKALILNRACANCSLLPNQASFRQNYVTQLCHQLPKKEAIIEICRMDGKDILDIICNLETEGEENTAFILCTTYFTQQLQQDNLYCAWELTLLWSKLQRRIDVSLESFLERCLQFGSIARTIYHCLFLIRVIQTEAAQLGLAVSVDLCVKALWQEETDAKALVCKMVSSLLSEDLEVIRACQLTEFVLSPSQEAFDILEELHTRPDQKYDEENALIPNSMRCELLLALKAHWHFDPEFWDWKTLKRHCIQLLGLEPEEEVHDDSAHNSTLDHQAEILNGDYVKDEDKPSEIYGIYSEQNEERSFSQKVLKSETIQLHNRSNKVKKHTFRCQLCHKEVAEAQICHHAKRHEEDGVWTCPMCLEQFRSRKLFVPHAKKHVRLQHWKKENVKEKSRKNEDGVDDHEPGKIRLDPSHAMYSQSTHDPAVLEHILEASSVPNNDIDDDFITFDYINTHFSLQNRDVYQCPATDCSKTFKLYKYLGVHLKNDHNFRDPNVKHYLDMKDRREKCTFCRKTFMTSYHQRKHCKVHYKDHPYSCAVTGCGAHFDTTNELVTHKREHGFRLTYCCDLTGCGFAYCDLGQLYHHEAQHFRDAAFTCVSPGCKMYFYSRKEFVNHLAGHDMKFTDKDFERQRAVKKDLRPLVEDSDLRGTSENGFQKAEKPSGTKEQGSLTCVAVCFDGKKFICGLNKCGKSFALVKEIQKHLKHDHADDFVEEDKLFKKKKKKNNKVTHSDTEASEIQQKSLDAAQDHLSSEESTQEKNESQPKLGMEPDVVMTELMLRLNNLTLNCPGSEYGLDVGTDALGENSPDEKNKSASDLKRTHSKSDPVKHETKSDVTSTDLKRMQSKSDPVKEKNKSDAIATTLKTTMIKLERVKEKIDLDVKKLIKPRSKFESESGTLEKLNGCVPENQQLKRKSEIQIQGELQKKGVSKKNSQLSSKSYTCNGKNCYFQSDTNEGLKQHYMKVHCFSEKDAKEMSAEQLKQELLAQGTSKPFVCDAKACHYQSVTSEALLKHYTNIHNFTVEKVKKMEVFQPKIFKPFQCLLCQKDYSSKKQLKVHYFTLHNIEQSVLQQMCCSLRINSASSSKKKKSLQPLKINKLKSKRTDRCLWQQRCQKPNYRFHKINHKTGKGKAELSFSSNRDMADDVKSTPTSNCTNPTIQPCSELHLCVHRNCKASFNSLKNLLHHLLSEHHYQRSQLYYPCKFSGCSKLFGHYSSLTRHLRREHNLMQKNFLKTSIIVKKNDTVKSEEPIPRFKCTYTNCNESYHLKSSLLRHTDFVHHNQTLQNSNGDLNSRSKKQALYQKCHAPDSLVVRLQSTPKNDESNHGCQTKLIVSTSSQSSRCCLKDEEKETATESVEPKSGLEKVALRTHEEAFQMCQDRCLPVAFPCMVQKCNSVVTTKRSLYRHYIAIHKLHRKTLTDNKAKLVYSVEQLEEMIQKKSALPDVVRTPNGVLKMQYQPATKGGPSLPVSLHSIKARLNKQATEFSDVPDRNLVAAAEDLLYCPPKSEIFIEIPNHSEKSEPTHPLVRPPPLDLSPPSNLRITLDDCTLELSGKGTCGKSMTIPTTVAKSVSNPTRQPLRRKNEYSDHPAQIPPASIPKDLVTQAFAPEAFDITTYKPMGFETSFLKFIQEKDEFESPWTTVVTNPCLKTDSPRRRDCFRRNYSVKENNQRGSSISRKIRSSPLKHLISKGDCTSIHNLRLILERALSGCGDQAIEQLQILKPVVVLERPESFASILDLLPS